MKKRYSILSIFVLLTIIQSCTDTLEPEFVNSLDPKSENYNPTPASDIIIDWSYNPIGLEISWSDNSLGEIGFIIERKDTKNPQFVEAGFVQADSNKFFDAFIPDIFSTYEYRIKTLTEYGSFTYSSESHFVMDVIKRPSDLKVDHISNSSLILRWKNNSQYAESFQIKLRDKNEVGQDYNIVGEVDKNTSYFTVEGLDSTKVYELKLTLVNNHYELDCDSILSAIYGVSLPTHWMSSQYYYPKEILFSPNENICAISGDYLGFFNLNNSHFTGTTYSSRYMSFTSDGSKIAFINSSRTPIFLMNVESLTIERALPYSADGIVFHPQEDYFLIWDNDNAKVKLIEINSLEEIWSQSIWIYGAIFNSDGSKIYCSSGDKILILNTNDGSLIDSIDPLGIKIGGYCLTKDDSFIFIQASADPHMSGGAVEVWNLSNHSLVKVLEPGLLVAISPDQNLLAFGTFKAQNHFLSVYRISDFEKIGEVGILNHVKGISFNYSSDRVAVATSWGYPRIFKIVNRWRNSFN